MKKRCGEGLAHKGTQQGADEELQQSQACTRSGLWGGREACMAGAVRQGGRAPQCTESVRPLPAASRRGLEELLLQFCRQFLENPK